VCREHVPGLARLWLGQRIIWIGRLVAPMRFHLVAVRSDRPKAVFCRCVDRAVHRVGGLLKRNFARSVLAKVAHVRGSAVRCRELLGVQSNASVALSQVSPHSR
jgi:hypothetical protein